MCLRLTCEPKFPGDIARLIEPRRRRQDQKLFSTPSSDEVLITQISGMAIGDKPPDFVANDMAVAIIHVFEQIVVKHRNATRLS